MQEFLAGFLSVEAMNAFYSHLKSHKSEAETEEEPAATSKTCAPLRAGDNYSFHNDSKGERKRESSCQKRCRVPLSDPVTLTLLQVTLGR